MAEKTDLVLAGLLDADAVARYERALRDAADVQKDGGRWLTVELPNGCQTIAPLWKALQAAEAHAARVGRDLRAPGRPGWKSFEDKATELQRAMEELRSPLIPAA